jgi:7-cyano-7-deazaguanine synthase
MSTPGMGAREMHGGSIPSYQPNPDNIPVRLSEGGMINQYGEISDSRPVDSVAVVSGGMDSVAMLYSLVHVRRRPLVLSFNYGQKHSKELEFAACHADALDLPHKIVDLTSVSSLLSNSALVGDAAVPEGHYADDTMKATVVPNRNMIMIAIAAAACINYGGNLLGVGVHAGDHPVYPDCRPKFIDEVEQTLKTANVGFISPDFRLYAPWLHRSKDFIVQQGELIGVPWGQTWSCYKGEELHCGLCGTCVERREAFELARVDDPTVYSYED